DGIRDFHVTGVQTCALPILLRRSLLFFRYPDEPSSIPTTAERPPWRADLGSGYNHWHRCLYTTAPRLPYGRDMYIHPNISANLHPAYVPSRSSCRSEDPRLGTGL